MNKVIFPLTAIAIVLAHSTCFAATVSGPDSTETVASGDLVQDWIVSDLGKLILGNNSSAGNISVVDGTLEAGNTGISITSIEAKHDSNVSLTGTTISNAGGRGLETEYDTGGSESGSTINVKGSDITGTDAAVSIVGDGSVITLDNTRATSTALASSGIKNYGGLVNIINGSSVTGAGNGILIETDNLAGTRSDVVIDNASVSGSNGSAIAVGNLSSFDSTVAGIIVRNGARLSGSDGNLLTVTDLATANMSVENTSLTGNIVNGPESTTNLSLADSASLTGILGNVTAVNLDNTSRLTLAGNSFVHSLTNAGLVSLSGALDADSASNTGTLVMNSGSALRGNLTSSGTVALSEGAAVSATLEGNMINSGSIVLNPTSQSAGNTLTINGNYEGLTGSSVSLGSVLAGDSSLTDKLVITGNTSGESTLNIANENGASAQTLEGIQVVQVDGLSDGVFTLGNRLVAGNYDYRLQKGNVSGSDRNDWYLTSYINTPDNPGTDNPPPSSTRMVRPEAGSYIANLQASRTLFNLSLHDRAGETQYADPQTGEIRTTSMWMRNEGGRNTVSLSDRQNKTTANRYVLQIGGDVAAWDSATDGKAVLGILGGYANQHSDTHNSLTGYASKGSVNGYSAGLYGTWYQNAEGKAGLYVDSWLQYAWFNNEVKGQDLTPETYKSKGLTASAETGYNWRVASLLSSAGMENSVWLQPHAQIIWSGVRARAGDRTVSVSAPGCAEPDMVDGFRYGRTGQWAQDQVPDLCG